LENNLKQSNLGIAVGRIDSGVTTTRAAILHAFSPNYNPPATSPGVPRSLDVLVCTDVLAEGVNLQEAGAIVSYDIHWNPVRLIQRIGRVDRRIDPAVTPIDHYFDILNVLPPPEIENIINLVGAVENRTYRISRALGLDDSFFKSDDPAGTLKEFNAAHEGTVPLIEQALNSYAALSIEPPDDRTLRVLKSLPMGALCVWANAPVNGVLALYTLQPTARATADDVRQLESLIGQPILLFSDEHGSVTFDAGEIFGKLSQITPETISGSPSDESRLKTKLAELRKEARQMFNHIELPGIILPRLECWMELRT
jgi:hypothetical protein